MNVPASRFPLMDFSVGDNPGDIRFLSWIFGLMTQGGLFAAIAFLRVQMRSDAIAAARGE